MSRHVWGTAGYIAVLLLASVARAQELSGSTEKETPAPLGVEKFYWDLSKSEDRALKTMVERYVNLVKVQEWSDLTGKFKTVAHYVKHDPNLTTVTIRVMKGKGADRTSEDKTVPVDKLSKTCQSRVKQIDTMQKKLKEAAAKSKEGVAGATPENSGSPMTDERGVEPGAAGPGPGPGPGGAGPPAVPEPDPSAAEPDPLGFAEIQFDQPPGPGAGPGPGPEGGPVPPPTER